MGYIADWVLLVVGLLLVAGVTGVALLSGSRRRRGGEEDLPPGGGTDVLTPPRERTDDETTATEPATDVVEPDVEPDVEAPTAPPAPEVERPEGAASRLVRLRQRLSRSQGGLGKGLLALLSRDRLDEDTWEDIEDTLLGADIGVAPTQQLVERLRTRLRVEGGSADVRAVLKEELLSLVDPSMDRRLAVTGEGDDPGVVLVVGVNGTGKTTTVGKVARLLRAEDMSVVLGAADTFRAAAAEQLTTWGERVGVEVVRGPEGTDPASVAFDAVKRGKADGVDTVLVDTAGRLQNKAGLMDELGKVKRVIEKQAPVTEVLLVLDATTGQNGMVQARVFADIVDVSGIVLTKLDGSAKGGIVVAVQRELGVPVKLVGLGEGPDDLAPFDAEAFTEALLG
ncbi:signal recognition particle-docking protein FtsY [Nocardioides sp. CFH 31398]|uniref:signal recognition particle-docking protein FtsY n=1 Tax=Nocardioides sp. CFH 31398 TaxID=2919579 RepID=UPI001F056019|nr:signal recognition particle-docking protein FtsY [Nocardioides sp. CFH 31398]MCH1868661.1 signal recognition particle-docking protein FtsY [Nocardioides sp. CFH 31398]